MVFKGWRSSTPYLDGRFMRGLFFRLIAPLIVIGLLTACFSARESGKKANTSRHMDIHKQGITIDATYDPRLDNLIPGYKILTVAVTNNSIDVLRLNPLKDRWEIVDAVGQKKKAITSLRIRDPKVFDGLPDKVQQLVDYPVGIAVGYAETIDLFFPVHQELDAFRSISFYSEDRQETFDVLSNVDNNREVPVNSMPAQFAPKKTDPRFK